MLSLSYVAQYIKTTSTVLLTCIGLGNIAWAVEKAEKKDFDELLGAIYRQWEEEEVAYEVLQEQLWEYYQEPLSLNQASPTELQQLCILNSAQLDHLFAHLAKKWAARFYLRIASHSHI